MSEGFEIRQMFEYEIHRKLSMRAKCSTSEMSMINNAFKFYDINNTGTVGKAEWVKVFGRIGLNGFSEKDLLFLFDIYDINQSGKINYKNFTAYLYDQGTFEPISGTNEQQKIEAPQSIPVPQVQETKENTAMTCPTPMRNEVRRYFKSLVDALRYKINIRNGVTYYTFAAKLKNYEDKLRKTISFESFAQSVNDIQVNIDMKCMRDFFAFVDLYDENAASTEEILRLVKGPLSEKRKLAIVNQFALIDTERKGFCAIALLKKLFNSAEHPEVKSGRRTQNEIYGEFIYTIDIYANIKEKGDQISFEDFIDYYHGISASIDNDDYFTDMINGVWSGMQSNYQQQSPMNYPQRQQEQMRSPLPVNKSQMTNATSNRRYPNANQIRYNPINNTYVLPNQQNNQPQIVNNPPQYQPPQQIQPPQNQITNSSDQRQLASAALTKLRTILKSRGTKGIFGIQRMFKIFDRNHSHKLEFSEFENLCNTYRLNLSADELSALFSSFDVDNSNKIDYDELLRTLVGVMNEYRINLIKKVFSTLDRNNNGQIEIEDIKGMYNASRHPEVVAGKKTEQEILGEWLDNFETFNEYNETGIKNRRVTFDEFINYYNMISMSIEDDRYFEYMVNNCWNLDRRNNFYMNNRARAGAEVVNNFRNY